MTTLELKIPPPIVAALLAVGMWLLPGFTAGADLPFAVRATAALAVALVGLGISLAGTISFRRAKTTVNPLKPQATTALVTGGIYRWTRNPMYLGFLLVLCALAVFLARVEPVAGPIIFMLYMNRFQIRPEERVLTAKFGEGYAAYRARVRRWL